MSSFTIFYALVYKNFLEYALIALSEPKSVILYIESHSKLYIYYLEDITITCIEILVLFLVSVWKKFSS